MNTIHLRPNCRVKITKSTITSYSFVEVKNGKPYHLGSGNLLEYNKAYHDWLFATPAVAIFDGLFYNKEIRSYCITFASKDDAFKAYSHYREHPTIKLVECTIPKGFAYFIGVCNNQKAYCSSAIVYNNY